MEIDFFFFFFFYSMSTHMGLFYAKRSGYNLYACWNHCLNIFFKHFFVFHYIKKIRIAIEEILCDVENTVMNRTNKMSSWSGKVPRGPWQEVGKRDALKNSLSIVAQKGPSFTRPLAANTWLISFSSLTPCLLLASQHCRNQQHKNTRLWTYHPPPKATSIL